MRILILCSLLLMSLAPSVAAQPVADDCRAGTYLPTRLMGGMYARVTAGAANNVRESYSTSSPIISTISAGTEIFVTSAPRCAEGYVWYQVMYRLPTSTTDFPFGYTVEGDLATNTYFLEPAPQSLIGIDGTPTINAANLSQLKAIGQVELGLPNRMMWADDSNRLGVMNVGGLWVYDVTSGVSEMYNPEPYLTNNFIDFRLGVDDGVDRHTLAGGLYAGPSSPLKGGFQQWREGDTSAPIATSGLFDQYNGFSAAAGPRIALGNDDGSVSVFDATGGAPTVTLAGLTMVGVLQYSRNGAILVGGGSSGMGGTDNNLYVWDTATWSNQLLLTGNVAPYWIAVSNDGQLVARYEVSPRDPTIQGVMVSDIPFSSISTGYFLDGLYSGYRVSALAFTADNSTVVVAANPPVTGSPSYAVFVDIATGRDVGALEIPAGITSMAFSPDGRYLAVAHSDPLFWGPDRIVLYAVVP
jgi:WD40 repeat protein